MITTTRPRRHSPAVPSAGTTAVVHRQIRIATTEDDFRAVTELWDQYDAWVASTTGRRLVDAQPDFVADRVRPQAEFPAPGAVLLGRAYRHPAGVVGLRAHGDEAELTRFFVGEIARGTGLGRALLDRAIAVAWLQGFSTLRLETVPAHMPVAASMYARAGFLESSRRTHLGLEAVTMTLDLAALAAGDIELDLEDPVP